MIYLNNISKEYITPQGRMTALQHINLHVKPGEIFGIVGKSGAGKSTLIRIANLLEKPNLGQVLMGGLDLTKLSESELRQERRKIGMIFQHFNLLSSRTVYDNIALPLELANFSKQEIHETVMPLLDLVKLTDKKNYFPSQLSGGQKQRVAIARAIANKPKVLLSDEATSSLDPETTIDILDLLKNIRDTLGITILLITHEMSVIKHCCDRVAILHRGEVIEENDVAEFFAFPKTAIAQKFIESSLLQTLPPPIAEHISKEEKDNTHPVWRLWFLEKTTTQPIITKLINDYNLRINILQANVEYIKKHAIGIMILAIDGDKEKLRAGLNYLKSINVETEVIGHVPNDVIPFS
jgi:D-methionine transport system ATP-binding protein